MQWDVACNAGGMQCEVACKANGMHCEVAKRTARADLGMFHLKPGRSTSHPSLNDRFLWHVGFVSDIAATDVWDLRAGNLLTILLKVHSSKGQPPGALSGCVLCSG